MPLTRAGRPRLQAQRRPGVTARDEILDAAGELFTTQGYAGTSTRHIAEAVGIRQASLYHYFKTKDDILCALLSQTVSPTLSIIPLLREAEPAMTDAQHLHALAVFDGRQLLSGRWNLGALYLLPELRDARLEPFYSERERLRLHYLELSMAILADTGVDPAAADLPFRLVESLTNMWSTPEGPDRLRLPGQVADACLRVLGVTDPAVLHDRTREALTAANR
ncbi:TetR/AcrR family transcriptional regulator [Mycolicibacterium sp. 018/SC-01/001]|uniref:TetR/AcrR family transcriptional regulator n=1 Tax=Mycolicibacterium sp. 018/SC-01/001 TaxID=2592069 RepID=UPI001180850F|nr:TetR/AcrR family transcriptional regulator [Mycolicibacterium sp. 018/SC-01/001]TRW81475.1 TetR/AcrR family transcriptional regulator [Mycolicibacterium sp. 018/SC-01/001]